MHFDFYGLRVDLSTTISDLLIEEICQDFNHFSTTTKSSAAVEFIVVENPVVFPQGFLLAKTKMCEVRQITFSKRQMLYIHHRRPVGSVIDESKQGFRKIVIQVSNRAYVEEILFFSLNSVIGEHFDSIGLMRIHAAALTVDGKNYIFAGASQSGKSTLAERFSQRPGSLFFSDELALFNLKSLEIWPFPIRRAIKIDLPKGSSLSFFAEKELKIIPTHLVASRGPLHRLIELKVSHQTALRLSSILERLSLSWTLFWGLGVIQMWEYLLRFDNFTILSKIAWNRMKLVAFLWNQPIEIFERSGAQDENLKTLESLLSKR